MTLRLLLFFLLGFISAQGWSYVSTTPINYDYDTIGYYVINRNIEFEAQKFNYDDTSNLRYCCSETLNSSIDEKALDGPFFVLVDGLVATKGVSKSAKEMADDLAGQINKNSVSFTTPGKTGHIDLRGKSHFDKKTQTTIDTPHVQTRDLKVGPNGHVTAPKKTEITRPATKQDIRTARKLAERQGLL